VVDRNRAGLSAQSSHYRGMLPDSPQFAAFSF